MRGCSASAVALFSAVCWTGALAAPEIAEATLPGTVLDGFEFDAELELSWPSDSLPAPGALRNERNLRPRARHVVS